MIHATAAAKMVVLARVRFWMEPIRAMAAVTKAVRCVTEPILAKAVVMKGVQPDATAADHSGVAFHCAMAADRNCAAIRYALDDPLPGSHHDWASNAVYQRNRVTECCVHFPANCESGQECGQQSCIRFHAAGGRDERSAHPESGLAKLNYCRRCEPERFDLATQSPAGHYEPEARRLRLCLEPPHDPIPALGVVQSPELPAGEQFQSFQPSVPESELLEQV